MSASVPSPGTDDQLFKLTDEGAAQYIEFPKDTIFIESVASNETFAKGVGYVAAQRKSGPDGQPESWVYEIRPGMTEAKELFGPLSTNDGTAISVFGSAVSTKGKLYLCAFNRNSVIDYDLTNPPAPGSPAMCISEIPNLPSPNDMCIDPKDESILYVCGGTFRTFYPMCTTFTNSAFGQVFRVKLDAENGAAVTPVKEGLDTLAGIEVVGDDVWTAQLYDIFSLNQKKNYDLTSRWKGNDGAGQVWLADNIDVFFKEDGSQLVLSPAYSMASESAVNNVLQRNYAMSGVLFMYQLMTMFSKGETLREALKDPEVNLSLSNTYITEGVDPKPLKIMMMTPDGTKAYHFEVDLKETRERNAPWEPDPKDNPGKMRYFFNEQVTHASHLRTEDGSGYVVCVNFEQPRILLLKDTKFKECIAKKA